MTRFVSSLNEAAFSEATAWPVVLAALDFTSGMVRTHNVAGELEFGGNTYIGVGQFAGIEVPHEDPDGVPRAVTLILSAQDPDLVMRAWSEVYQRRSVSIYYGVINPQTMDFVDAPELAFSLFMNTMTISASAEGGEIRLICDHEMWFGASSMWNTNESAQLRNAGEKGFEFTKDIPGFKASWGDKPTSFTGQISPGGPFFPGFRGERP